MKIPVRIEKEVHSIEVIEGEIDFNKMYNSILDSTIIELVKREFIDKINEIHYKSFKSVSDPKVRKMTNGTSGWYLEVEFSRGSNDFIELRELTEEELFIYETSSKLKLALEKVIKTLEE